MIQRPTVTATYRSDPITEAVACVGFTTTPGIDLTLTFELHDHEAALALLLDAMRDVRAQVEQAKGASA